MVNNKVIPTSVKDANANMVYVVKVKLFMQNNAVVNGIFVPENHRKLRIMSALAAFREAIGGKFINISDVNILTQGGRWRYEELFDSPTVVQTSAIGLAQYKVASINTAIGEAYEYIYPVEYEDDIKGDPKGINKPKKQTQKKVSEWRTPKDWA